MASKEDYLKFMSEVRKVSGVDTLTPDGTELERDDSAYDKLVVKCTTERRIEGLSIRNAQGQNDEVAVKPGSKLTTDHTIGIPMAELDRMADVDFEAYDYMAVQHRIDDPNVEKPYQNPGNLVGPGFAFSESVSVSTHCKLTVN